ncbi:sigma-70 family RNA polymerase sigma factor [Microbacterium sp. Marseille-Q6965]|uniref:sigma-70 family RNA polymerase sigma factor n=1 Tax=Microbacterium sp. Marseille-Q6965 TaxID=2965072 RepID=UPI0021B7EF7F|nr:sigma-70 family RNA polymerase sigma factor [Microbacterium sp. Marseille-Q6965]
MTSPQRREESAGIAPETTPDALVLAHMDLARAVARRYFRRNASRDEDLVQVAYIGLVKAARRFDPERGNDFAAFAAPTITGEIKRHLRDAGWFVRPPRRVQELRARISEASPRLAQSFGREPTASELCTDLGESRAEVREALACGDHLQPASLDVPVGADRDLTMGQLIPSERDEIGRAESAAVVRDAMSALAPRDRRVVQLRFFEERTQSDIAGELGVTQMQVSRILARTLAAMRDHIQHGPPPARRRAA